MVNQTFFHSCDAKIPPSVYPESRREAGAFDLGRGKITFNVADITNLTNSTISRALHRLDQSCFPAGHRVLAYDTALFSLAARPPMCVVALDGKKIVGFILTEENPPLAHTITLDVAPKTIAATESAPRCLAENEKTLALHGVRHVLIETAIDNQAAVAFWQRHGYRIEAVLKRYYLGRIDAYEMRKILPAATTAKSAQKET